MKKFSLFNLCILAIIYSFLFIACEDENDQLLSTKNCELDNFLQSASGKDFMENFNVSYEDFNVKKISSIPQKKDVKVLSIPLNKGNKDIGRLCIVSNNKGKIFQALYEDWSEITEEGGDMKVFTVDHQYLANWKVTREGEKFAFRLTDVFDVSDYGAPRLKTKTEFPQKGESGCTAKCYTAAREACDADPECKILCDLIDAVSGCLATLSIATACAIYCNT